MVFDLPKHEGTYGERYNYLGKMHLLDNFLTYTYQPTADHFTKNPSSVIEVAPKVVCRDAHHMETFFQDVVDKGGEGIILRDPTAPYESGRSKGYLKHKVR